jgi:hypothetical protein
MKVFRSLISPFPVQELYGEAVQAQQEGRHELAKHRYRQILEGPLLKQYQQQRTAKGGGGSSSSSSSSLRVEPTGLRTGALAGEELLGKMRYLAMKNTAEVLQLEGRRREAGEAFAAATGAHLSCTYVHVPVVT